MVREPLDAMQRANGGADALVDLPSLADGLMAKAVVARRRDDPSPEAGHVRAKLAVGIATAGRPAILVQMLRRLQAQTRPPDAVVVCAPGAADLDGVATEFPRVTLATGVHGLPSQRNAILRWLVAFDLVVFFDDDFVPEVDYLQRFEGVMRLIPDVVMTTGHILKDGILGPGLTFEAADNILGQAPRNTDAELLRPIYNSYGCNMGIRLAPVRRHGLAFDERLPLYGWLEDVDFSRQLARFGRVVRCEATRGVHLGVKLGRQPGARLGYSQIANPLHLIRKGTMCRRRALYLMSRNLAANVLRSLRPEPWVDRKGRLNGNLHALVDFVLARLDPGRAASL